MRLSVSIVLVAAITLGAHLNPSHAKPVDQETTTTAATTLPTNHRINFLGLQHGYPSNMEARADLAERLKRITGHNEIVIDSLDERGAIWHFGGQLGSADGPCPEAELRQLVAKISEPNTTEYSREVKMELNDMFLLPSRVKIEWLGPCGNIGRKRSRVEGAVGPALDNGLGGPVSMIDEVIIEPQPAATESTGASDILQESTTVTPPTTTTPPPSTTPTPPPPQTTEPPLMASSSSTPASLFPSLSNDSSPLFDASFGNFSDIGNFSLEFPTTTTQPPPESTTTVSTTTTTSTTTTPAPSESSSVASQPIIPPVETSETSTLAPTTTTVAPPAPSEEEGTTTANSIDLPGSESSATESAAESSSAGPHYGKYIGLSAAFLIFVAYLVCSRAYRRHGTYELHSE